MKGENKMKIFRNIIVTLSVIFLLWFVISYIDITSQNLSGNVVLHNWNFFGLLI